MRMEEKKETRGGVRSGAGRPALAAGQHRVKLWISTTENTAAEIQEEAAAAGKTLSAYILDKLGKTNK